MKTPEILKVVGIVRKRGSRELTYQPRPHGDVFLDAASLAGSTSPSSSPPSPQFQHQIVHDVDETRKHLLRPGRARGTLSLATAPMAMAVGVPLTVGMPVAVRMPVVVALLARDAARTSRAAVNIRFVGTAAGLRGTFAEFPRLMVNSAFLGFPPVQVLIIDRPFLPLHSALRLRPENQRHHRGRRGMAPGPASTA